MICDDPVCFMWRVTSQGPCVPHNGSCGPGFQEQTLECFSATGEQVPSDQCSGDPPPVRLSCEMPCPGDCVLGHWGPWTSCSQSCSSKHHEGKQSRSRLVLALPGKYGKPCPLASELEQWRPCGMEPCTVYYWDASPWDPCMPNTITDESEGNSTAPQMENDATCGTGVQMRQVTCRRAGNGHVLPKRCPESSRPDSIRSCPLPCKIDCIVTPFSEWSACPSSCLSVNATAPTQSRHRIIIQTSANGGQECPDTLYEERECDPLPLCPTYRWQTHRWHQCILVPDSVRQAVGGPAEACGIGLETREVTCVGADDSPADMIDCVRWAGVMPVPGADCGEGVSQREISCVVHWGSLSGPPQPVPVEDKMCVENSQSNVSEIELQQPCTIPCPGECHLTKWSQWSSCQLLCLDGRSFETWGRQARSRAVVTQVPENQDSCPSQMYETRPCRGGTCLSYEWMSGEWRHNHRLVWCQRSDGVNVTGGCIAQNQPSTVRQCHPPCTKPFSFCTQNGVCGCEKGFTEVMTSHGFLDYCTRTPGLDHKKADVKTTAGRLRPEHARNKNHIKDWALQPLGPDGRVKLWVYGLMAGGFVVILLLIIMSFLLCKNPEDSPSSSPQKALALAYDGDVDM
ncbi:thrombospondin type-1 domain-containing 7B-like protein [Labeo rohita]|uniref:Thrombospondin type-1 domain-containing 7B-like protein n=1 Tax=Labeo rohita TaxID=84645 RepID=A0A498NQG2_LABRO|nr:thrombospondin type-1 domain-containing 7B-like protein [Labeo rohita]